MDALATRSRGSPPVPPPGSPPLRPGPAARPAPRPAPRPVVPETLHPALWLGHQLGRTGQTVVSSGFPALDAELPGGGWPKRALSELLLPHPGVGEIRLLAAPLLAAQREGRLLMAFDPPAGLSAEALGRLGIDVARLLVVRAVEPGRAVAPGGGTAALSSLWAVEQALKSGHVGAVLCWLPPRLAAGKLRRLQLAAQSHDGPAFVLREAEAAGRPTAAPLRVALEAAGADRLSVHLLKRRGPPLEAPIALSLPAVLSATATRRSPRAGASMPKAERSLAGAAFVDLG